MIFNWIWCYAHLYVYCGSHSSWKRCGRRTGRQTVDWRVSISAMLQHSSGQTFDRDNKIALKVEIMRQRHLPAHCAHMTVTFSNLTMKVQTLFVWPQAPSTLNHAVDLTRSQLALVATVAAPRQLSIIDLNTHASRLRSSDSDSAADAEQSNKRNPRRQNKTSTKNFRIISIIWTSSFNEFTTKRDICRFLVIFIFR